MLLGYLCKITKQNSISYDYCDSHIQITRMDLSFTLFNYGFVTHAQTFYSYNNSIRNLSDEVYFDLGNG